MTEDELFVALPMYGLVAAEFCFALIDLVRAFPQAQIKGYRGSLVPESRNTLTAEFLSSDCARVLFIDCDILFERRHVEMILEHDEPIVGGLCPFKVTGPCRWVGYPDPNKAKANGLLSMDWIGAGFLSIHRSVFEMMIKQGVAPAYKKRTLGGALPSGRTFYDFWRCGVINSGGYVSEDNFFCLLARNLGFKTFADTRIQLRHLGQISYPASENPFHYGKAV